MTIKNITSITLTLLIAFLVVSCNHSTASQEPTPQTKERVIYLGCELPGENSPRMELKHTDSSTPLRMYWQQGDVIQVGFRQETKTKLASATVQAGNIQSDRTLVKNVPISVPSEIDPSKPYKIYLVWGPSGTLAYGDGIFYLKLPELSDIFMGGSDYTTTDYYGGKKLPILYTKKEMNGGEKSFSVKLQHLGSFFALHLANRTSTWTSNYWCKVEDKAGLSADNEEMYVWNNGLPCKKRNNFGSKFDLETEKPLPASDHGIVTLFKGKKAYPGIVWDDVYLPNVPKGGKEQVRYVWYPVTSGVKMPALKFSISNDVTFQGGYHYSSQKCLPEGKTLAPGRVYHFYVEIQSGYKPVFCDRNWQARTDVVD